MKWQARVEDPSGETRLIALQSGGAFTLGRSDQATIPLRDSTVALEAACFWSASLSQIGQTGPTDQTARAAMTGNLAPFWMRVNEGMPPAFVGDLGVREAQIPAGVVIQFGESRITFEPLTSDMGLPSFPHGIRPWLTQSQEGRELLWIAKKAAATPLSLYVAGETGTGKEVLAHLLHAWSDRASGAFVPLHCGALSLSLIESELFGHVKGAFTGAHHQRPGALMQAHNGTLFLDEVGDLPLDIQVKLLRFLENGEIRPVGADRCSHADVRLLCATHHPLMKLVEQGKFRRDLYYRLASVTLQIPSLRSRPEDIDLLALKFAKNLGRSLSPQALMRLKAHRWPGNVRELRHAVERASGLAGPFSPVLSEDAFQFLLTPENVLESPEMEVGGATLSLVEMERIMLIKALKIAHGNRAQAAKILGVARSTLFEMLKRHKITGPRTVAPVLHIAPSIGERSLSAAELVG